MFATWCVAQWLQLPTGRSAAWFTSGALRPTMRKLVQDMKGIYVYIHMYINICAHIAYVYICLYYKDTHTYIHRYLCTYVCMCLGSGFADSGFWAGVGTHT